MRNAIIALGLAAIATLAGCAVAETQSIPIALTEKQSKLLDKELGGKVAGEPVSCISSFNADNIIRISDDMLLFRLSGRLVYQNRLKSPCHGLASDQDVMVMEQFGGQKCRGDLIRLVDRTSGFPGGFCSLGDFVPYRKAARVLPTLIASKPAL